MLVIALFCLRSPAEVRLLTGDAGNALHDRDSWILDLSADGNLVLFSSGPPVVGATPGITRGGLYLRNIKENTLSFVGVPAGGENNNDPTDAVEASMSDDGRFIAWATLAHAPLPRLIYWRDHQAGETRLVTAGADGDSRRPIVSGDGRQVAFLSIARNLPVPAGQLPAAGRAAVYLYDSAAKTTSVASVAHAGQGLDKGVGTGPGAYYEFDFSSDGRHVFFSTDSTNVHPSRANAPNQAWFWMYRRNVQNGQVDVVSKNAAGGIPNGNFTTPVSDATGNRVLFAGGFVGLGGGPLLVEGYSAVFGVDLYLKDIASGDVWWLTQTTNRTTPDAAFGAGSVALSGDGKVAAFASSGEKFVLERTDPAGSSDSMDIFRVDVGPPGSVTNALVTKPFHGTSNVGYLSGPFLPHDGSYAAFVSRYHFPLIGQGEVSSIWGHGYGVGNLPAPMDAPPAPKLQIALSAGGIVLRWPDQAGFKAGFKSSLSEASWTELTEAASLLNGTNSLALPPSGKTRFFILRQP